MFYGVNDKILDYNSILEKCGVGKDSAQVIVKNFINLEEFYNDAEIVSIYNYCLTNINDPEILYQIIKLTDAHKTEETLTILLSMVQTPIPNNKNQDVYINLKTICIKAIANYKDSASLSVLLDCLNNKHEHYKIRLACADALGRIGDKYAVRPLLDVVEDEEEKSIYLKESATFALGLIGDTSVIDPLITILEAKHSFLGKFSFLKEKIIEALGKMNFNNRNILVALKNSLMDSSPMVRINAIEAIMNSQSEDAISLIRPCLNDENNDVKKNALIAIYNLSGRDILDEVISLPVYSEFLKAEAQAIIDEYEVDNDDGQ
ncbi:MAG: HEAT repeat domain-containing protein [bacterium]|nr:HEAT repeat domain-containing protein [bacterium]